MVERTIGYWEVTDGSVYEDPLENPAVQRWLERLESGKFQQGKNRLITRTPGSAAGQDWKLSFCCLGVACDVLAYERGVTDVGYSVISEDGALSLVQRYAWVQDNAVHTTGEYLPPPVMKALGLATQGGVYYTDDGVKRSLASDNDSGQSFVEIAATIRSRPRGLFVQDASDD